MSDVQIGHGTKVYMLNDASAWVQLAEVTEIGLPNPQVDDVEATHFLSPDRSKEYIAGLKDNGEIPLGMNYIAGSATDILLTGALQETRSWRIIVPTSEEEDGWVFEFEGVLKGYEKAVPIGDRQTATITIRVSGSVAEYAGS